MQRDAPDTGRGPPRADPDSTDGSRRADPRLPSYLVAGFGALIFAIATGQPVVAALGAPLLVLAALGLVKGAPGGLGGRVTLAFDRVIEGDLVEGEVHVEWDGVAEIDVMLSGWRGVTPVEPEDAVGWSLPAGRGPARLPFRLRGRSWGLHALGTLWVRARRPGGLLVSERRVASGPTLRVLPSPLRLDRMLKPAEPRAIAGMHLARIRGHGTDLAELRPYQPGDRLRDLSWATSARLAAPWVRVHHPERTGTVLLLLDSFFAIAGEDNEALARAARAAWAVASAHLRAQDRVGLLARGRAAAWVPPQGGRRARWMLLEELLTVGGAVEEQRERRTWGRRVVVPADALIVGVTSLRSRRFVRDLQHMRRAGHTTVALVIDTADLIPAAKSRLDEAAHRVWIAQRDAERYALERSGVATALVGVREGVGPAISSLRRRLGAVRRGLVGATAG